MTRLLAALVAALALLCGATFGTARADTWRVGTECTSYPFNFKAADGTYSGYDVDVAREIGKRLGHDVEIVCQQWDGMIPALLANKFDLIAASMGITEERRKKIDFSIPYRTSVGRFVAAKEADLKLFNADDSINVDGFKGIRIGLQRSTTYDTWIQAKVPSAEVMRYDSVDALFLDLKAGRVDAIMTNPMKAYDAFLKKDDGAGYAFVGPEIGDKALFGPGCGIGLRKGSDDLRKQIDTALAAMTKDGTLDAISKKYFPFAIYPTN
ncbi:amino acid ABC transporter [Labrys miyagiensis]